MRRSSSSAKVSNNVSNSGNRNLTPFEIVNIVPRIPASDGSRETLGSFESPIISGLPAK